MKPGRALAAAGLAALASASWAFAQAPAPEPTAAPPATAAPATPAVAPATAVAPVPTPAPTPAPDPNRITFELKVPPEKGGGTILGAAGSLETVGEADAILDGGVEIAWKDIKVSARRLVLHRDEMTVEAEGEVIFDRGPNRIGAERVELDLVTENGTFWNASAAVDPEIFFTGSVVSKVGPDEYEVADGVFTSCTGDPVPDWSFALTRARVTVGGYARISHARMRIKKLPVFYWPYMVWPAKPERTTGLLIPNVGYSRRRGAYLGLAHYQVLGPSFDNTIYLDLWEEEFAGLGSELRYRPTEGTRGEALAYALRDPLTEDVEWKARWNHTTTDLPGGLRGVVVFEDYSDFDFFRQFERAESENTRRFLYSNAFVSGSWGPHSLNVLADQRETFLGEGATVTQRQLPEVEYRLRKLKLGELPLYLSLDTTASFLQASSSGLYDIGYGRFDLHPELTLPVKVAPWLSMSVTGGGRGTWWGESVPVTADDPATPEVERRCDAAGAAADQLFCGEDLTRVFPTASAEIVGPSLSKIFEGGAGRFAKFKHVIEPRWSYVYVGDSDDQARVTRFDEIDSFRSTHVAEVALVNRILAKPADETQGGAFEIFSLEIAQAVSLDDAQPLQRSNDGTRTRAESGLVTRLRFNPSRDLSVQAQATYSTLFAGLESTSISGRADLGRVDLNLTWFTRYDAETSETRSDQARLGFGLDLWPKRLRLDGQVNYDLDAAEIQQQRYFLSYFSQCYGFSLELREQVTASFESRDYRFAITLKNVGTFLDVTGGDSAQTR
jgi:lipopolysaccharide assembly outer membrane protein LptD (OstA)